ncbi:MAG: hypothetical protein QGI78_04455 [Phycisphaerales bacterium]|jgi:hypothetical protein|nr:hypothetical protein [Phycisphaerales bacterium]
MFNPLQVTSLIAAVCFASPFAMANSNQLSMVELQQQHPKLRTMQEGTKITKMVAPKLATGRTAEASANAFIQTWSNALGVDAKDFIAEGPFQDRHHIQPIMYNQETGEYKFTGVYFKQTADGLPVYGSRLMTLVKNTPNNPIVNATLDLRDVAGFKRPARVANSSALALMSAATRFGSSVVITDPELMVFAGTTKEHNEPRAALVFEATVGSHIDGDEYQKAELVVDAETGEILQETNRILHVDGHVAGMATESSGADTCDPESAAGLPYAKVTRSGATAYTDANGNYSIAGSGNITSKLEGQWFNVNNSSGSDSSLSQSSSNPDFLHNAANSSQYYRAEVNAYLQSNIVRDFTLSFNPDFPTINSQTSFPVNVNIGSTCNAYYDYSSINFYSSGGGCSNTAFSVVVHHEYGHHLVEVAGSGQGQYGEGMGDVMGVLLTGDDQLARGFYSNDCTNGIRTADNGHQYPCTGGIHDCGQLISGCVWDTLAAMEASYPVTGHDIVSSLAINSMLLHSGDTISPSITYDWLTLDDDDGDLTNGTPHSAEILAGFALHSMDDFPEPLGNDECSTALAVIDGTHSFTTVGASHSSDSYNDTQCGGTYLGEMSSDVWFSYTACQSGNMVVSTCNTVDFDSDIVIYEGTCSNKTQIDCNGDGDNCSGYSSYTSFNVTDGNDYLIRVGGWSGDSMGQGQLIVDGPGEPCDTTPPCPGDVDGNGSVGVEDILAIVDMWGETGGDGDVDEDGTVGVGDILVLIDAWGSCPE